MCGIIGGTGRNIGPGILKGLQRLEYRGYDSFGLSLMGPRLEPSLLRRVGAPSTYAYSDFGLNEAQHLGIGHTRWATHGGVCEENAHPHRHDSRLGLLSVVHNGVVENMAELLRQLGPSYRDRLLSQTDTELLLMHIVQKIDQQLSVPQAISEVLGAVDGSFAFLLMAHDTQTIWAFKQDLPLLYVPGHEQQWLVSDLQALSELPTQAHLLADRQLFLLPSEGQARYEQPQVCAFFTPEPESIESPCSQKKEQALLLTEIEQQPQALSQLLKRELATLTQSFDECHIIGCGSSYHAGLIAAQLLEPVVQRPIRVFIASEFRAFPPTRQKSAILVALSQSGETADILAALREQGSHYQSTFGVCNREGAMLSRLVSSCCYLRVGAERSVASTKAFTAQILALWKIFASPEGAPGALIESWQKEALQIIENGPWFRWASVLSQCQGMMILGRGPLWSVAQEGALKMKELTYCHVHALPSSELKHGSLALIDAHCPVLMLLPADDLVKKNVLTCHEVLARGGDVFVIAECGVPQADLPEKAQVAFVGSLKHPALQAILFTLPLQAIAAYWAQLRGLDLDKPRNLAKSVTVE